MKRTLVRYRTKPDRTDENQRLIESVFQELRVKAPPGVRYAALKLADGTFIHFAAVEDGGNGNPILALEAFRAFQGGIRDRCTEPPQSVEPTVIGNYRMLDER